MHDRPWQQQGASLRAGLSASPEPVYANGTEIQSNGRVIAHRQEVDSEGRVLPSWEGCRVLSSDEVLLLGDTADSFDGRYWGPISRDKIEGVWLPVRF